MSRQSKMAQQEVPQRLATVASHVRAVDGLVQIPEYDMEQEEITESAFLTVFASDLLGNGETPILQFQGQSSSETVASRDAYSVFNCVMMHCSEKIRRSRTLLENLVKCMNPDNRAAVENAFLQGGDHIDSIKHDISCLMKELVNALEKRKPPRHPEKHAIYSDTVFLSMMGEGLGTEDDSYSAEGWTKIRESLEHHRAVARMQCKMYAEVLVDSTCHKDDTLTAEEGIGVRYSIWLINNVNDTLNGNSSLLSFDHGVEAMLLSNLVRREEEKMQLTSKHGGMKRVREDESEIKRSPCELKFCMYSDLFRNTYPGIYGISSLLTEDMKSDEFRDEFTASLGHSQLATTRHAFAKIKAVSSKSLEFFEKDDDGQVRAVERRVSCRFHDHFGAVLSIMRKHRSMQREQQDPLSYMKSDGPNGLDEILGEFLKYAQVLTEPEFLCETGPDGLIVAARCRGQLLQDLGVVDVTALSYSALEVEEILDNLDQRDPILATKIRLLVECMPWKPRRVDEVTGVVSENSWYCGVVVSFKSFLNKLTIHGHEVSKDDVARIHELQELVNSVHRLQETFRVEELQQELLDRERSRNLHFEGCEVLKSMVIQHPKFQGLKCGLSCDSKLMPSKVLMNCFFEIHIQESFPNRDLRFIDGERREFFLRVFKTYLRTASRARVHRDVFVGNNCIGSGMLETVHGDIAKESVAMLHDHEFVHTEETRPEVDLHTITDLTKESPLYLWGLESARSTENWKARFMEEGIENYQESFSEMLRNFVKKLFYDVYTRDDMCTRSCALREGAEKCGVFGSIANGTLKRVALKDFYDVTMEASVNAKQILMHVYGSGYRQGFTHRASLQFTMVVLTSGDPTIGKGTARRQPVHGNILGGKGLGKSMIEDMLLDLFFNGYVVRKGKATMAAHRTLSKKQSLHCGADLMDEGNTDDRVSMKKGDNKETGNDQAEGKKERLSSGENRSTMAYPMTLPSGETAIATHEMISHCRNVCIWARNDDLSQLLGPLADRAVNWQLKRVATDVDPDEFAADEPVYNSDEHLYQEGVREKGRILVGQTLTLLNIFGALSGFATCIPGVDVSTISFMRSPIARVLERNGQPRFPPRMTSKVIEMMKVSSMLGVALETFWDPWGLFSENAVRILGGSGNEFTVEDMLRDPQLPIAGMMYCDFQDALSAYVQLLNQDRIDEVNAVRDAFVAFIKSSRIEFWDLFGGKYKGTDGKYTCDLNVIKIPVDHNAKTDWHTLRCIANKLKKRSVHGTSGGTLDGYNIQQIMEILTFLMEDERHGYQRHPDNLDVLLPTGDYFGMHTDGANFTLKGLQEYNKLICQAEESNVLRGGLAPYTELTPDKLNAVGKMWAKLDYNVNDDSDGRYYFPNAFCPLDDQEHATCDYIPDQMLDIKTLDISSASVHGFVTISTHWIFEGMRRQQNAKLSDISLQQQIIDEVAHSATNSGFYATQGIGMSNIKAGAPQCQDVFYVKFKNRDCTIQNTNYVSGYNHRMYGDSAGVLPIGMQSASKSLEPLVPDSLQDGMRAWENLMRSSPTVVITEHFMIHCDKRAAIIIAPFLLDQAALLYREWCDQNMMRTNRYSRPDGSVEVANITFTSDLVSPHRQLRMKRKHLHEVLIYMFDTSRDESVYGYRHLCRHYLHGDQFFGDGRGRDMHTSVFKESLFVRFKHWLTGKMIGLYECKGEGQLVFNAMNKTSSTAIDTEISTYHKEFNRIQTDENRPTMTLDEIAKLSDLNGRLEPPFTFAQSRLKSKLVAKQSELARTKRKINGLKQQICKEMGNGVEKYTSYLQSRNDRDDRPGAHSGKDYLDFIREKSSHYHTERQARWPRVTKEYN